MAIATFKLLPDSNTILVRGNGIVTTEENEVNKMIELAAKESGFSRWLANWDELFDKRMIPRKKPITNLPSVFSVINTVHLGYQFAYFGFIKTSEILYLLDDPSDLDELTEFVSRSFEFAKNLCSRLYNCEIDIDLPINILSTIGRLKPLYVLLKEHGFSIHIHPDRSPLTLHLDHKVSLILAGSPNEETGTFINTKSSLLNHSYQGTLVVSTFDLEKHIEERGEELIKSINAKLLANQFTLSENTDHNFDTKSYDFGVDLSWNAMTSFYIFDDKKLNFVLDKSLDGFILKDISPSEPISYFRSTRKEIAQLIRKLEVR